ncbi:SRPBCC domain-containing protein [Cognatiyoonia sp. IB215446]|uniref:SRPBCC family protein n=1 Tax=Cognatiyoonia sp. IB215446 TaxID=3097355 RepID=UPI002A109F5C|nr:SRPBCC domain-containing protein [Cognatiyoonia sp. IB215446]MDX8348218.1 SRPBCC domain-containing protein [Cognatiyoonia sp. IB215446]
MTDNVLEKSIYLKATPAQVWAYLTEPEKLAIWFHKPNNVLVDGPYEMFGVESGDRLMWGEVLVAEPFRRLEYTFTIKPMGDRTSMVKWALEEVAGGTRLSLRHEGLPQGEEAFGLMLALDEGWDDHLARMRKSVHAA